MDSQTINQLSSKMHFNDILKADYNTSCQVSTQDHVKLFLFILQIRLGLAWLGCSKWYINSENWMNFQNKDVN